MSDAHANSGTTAPDEQVLQGYAIRSKETERLSIWSELDRTDDAADFGDVPVLAFRRKGRDWYAALPLDDLFTALERGARNEHKDAGYLTALQTAIDALADIAAGASGASSDIATNALRSMEIDREASGNPVVRIERHANGEMNASRAVRLPGDDAPVRIDISEGADLRFCIESIQLCYAAFCNGQQSNAAIAAEGGAA